MRFLRRLVTSLVMTIVIMLSSGCTPEQVEIWVNHVNESKPAAEARGMPEGGLERLRECESGGRYDAINPSGKYRGAYQFDQQTWDGVARRWAFFLEGMDPATVWPWWQDHMALALYSERGAQPWPICGKRI